jgi:hypothetical protein
MDIASNLHEVGIALGSGTYGDPALAITRGLLVENFSSGQESEVKPALELRGDKSSRRVTYGGLNYPVSGGMYLDVGNATSGSIGDILASILGAEAITAVGTGKYKHRLTLGASDLPPWFNLCSNLHPTPKQVSGVRFRSAKFSIPADGPAKVSFEGQAKTESDLAAQTLAHSDAPILHGHDATTFKVGGSTVTNFDNVEITVGAGVDAFRGIGSSRDLTQLYNKSSLIVATLSGITFEDEVERAKFKAAGSTSFQIKLADANGNYLEFYFPSVYYTAFTDPALGVDELLKLSCAIAVVGNPANWYIDLQSPYAVKFTDGAGP